MNLQTFFHSLTATGSTLKHHTNLEQGNTETSENQESQSGNESTGNSGNTSNPGNGVSTPAPTPGGNVVTEPNAGFSNLDPSIWGDVDTGKFGGGEHTDMNVTLQ